MLLGKVCHKESSTNNKYKITFFTWKCSSVGSWLLWWVMERDRCCCYLGKRTREWNVLGRLRLFHYWLTICPIRFQLGKWCFGLIFAILRMRLSFWGKPSFCCLSLMTLNFICFISMSQKHVLYFQKLSFLLAKCNSWFLHRHTAPHLYFGSLRV